VLQYYARHFFAPLLVSSLETPDGDVEVWATSDLASPLSLTLSIQMWTWHGKLVGQWRESVKAEPHCSKAIWKRKVKDLLKTVLPALCTSFVHLNVRLTVIGVCRTRCMRRRRSVPSAS
jgi:hypothetical protein